MAVSARWTPATIAVASLLLNFPPAIEASGGRLLMLRVQDHSRTESALLARAHAIADAILEDPGIQVVWRGDPLKEDETCHPAVCLYVDVYLFGAQSTRLATGEATLGAAIVGEGASHTAFIFQDRVLAFAERNQIDAARLLGHVIAHEVGHLLLASRTHARTGLMRAAFTPDAFGPGAGLHLRFTAGEAAAIRRRLRATETTVARR